MKLKIFSFSLIVLLLFSILPFSSEAAEEKVKEELWDGVAFFGDSTTHGMIRYIVNCNENLGTSVVSLTRDQILTPPDGTFYLRNIPTTRILYRNKKLTPEEAIQSASPRILIVTVGVNGLPGWTKECFTELYNRLLDKFNSASPDTQIILQSIFPTAQIRAKRLKNFTVDRVDEVNLWIQEIAVSRNLVYINSADTLKGEDGWLNPIYQNGDGLHLNTAGYNQVLLTIQSVLQTQKGNKDIYEK